MFPFHYEIARTRIAEAQDRAAMYREYSRLPRPLARRRLVAIMRRLARRNGRTLSGPDCEELRVRYATSLDGDALARLAVLDSATLPPSPLLIAEADGELVAAMSLHEGTYVADPFQPSRATLELLALRAAQLLAEPSPRPRRARWSIAAEPGARER